MINQSPISSNSTKVKVCKDCGVSFTGVFCKPCKAIYNKKYREENKDRAKAIQAAWAAANPERRKATSAKYRKAHPEEQKQYYKANAEKIKARVREWYEKNTEKVSAYKKSWFKDNPEARPEYKARRRVRIGDDRLPRGSIKKLYAAQNGLCACCGGELGEKYHVDHIMPLALGGRHILGNIQLLLPLCNQRKSSLHPDVWRQKPQITSTSSCSSSILSAPA